MVRICSLGLASIQRVVSALEAMSTYDGGIDKRAPSTFILKKSENERDSGRTKQDDDKLVLELF